MNAVTEATPMFEGEPTSVAEGNQRIGALKILVSTYEEKLSRAKRELSQTREQVQRLEDADPRARLHETTPT